MKFVQKSKTVGKYRYELMYTISIQCWDWTNICLDENTLKPTNLKKNFKYYCKKRPFVKILNFTAIYDRKTEYYASSAVGCQEILNL